MIRDGTPPTDHGFGYKQDSSGFESPVSIREDANDTFEPSDSSFIRMSSSNKRHPSGG
jgi:hypothetical protein